MVRRVQTLETNTIIAYNINLPTNQKYRIIKITKNKEQVLPCSPKGNQRTSVGWPRLYYKKTHVLLPWEFLLAKLCLVKITFW
jgi:hypothetical protein